MERDTSSLDPDIIKVLKGLETQKANYPPELLAARRALFIQQIEERTKSANGERVTPDDEYILQFLGNLRDLDPEYPPELMAARRSAFLRQAVGGDSVSLWDVLTARVRDLLAQRKPAADWFPLQTLRKSLTAAAFVLAALTGFILYASYSVATSQAQNPVSVAGHVFLTPTEKPRILCKQGFVPPHCLAREIDKSHDLTYPGNGSARPAVAKDTMPSFGRLHRAENVNDGLYGPGASWVSNSPNSWIKIDLGRLTAMNTIAFGRDRLGTFDDGDPGRFVIAVADADDVYANGNSINDEYEYKQVYDSNQTSFDGTISGAETVIARFNLTEARYIKITFENARTAVDEVEAFVSEPPVFAEDPTQRPRDDDPIRTAVVVVSSTPVPADTATLVPTNTLLPTATSTLLPTSTNTPVPPTNTLVPSLTNTPIPTDTPIPVSTNTPVYIPTNTAIPAPTGTSNPPSAQSSRPTETSVPARDPWPTATSE